MPIFERFRGLTATRIAPIIVLSLATPLAFAQTTGKRYSGAAAVSDVNGNGYGDYAVVKWHPTEKKNFVYITDGITGNYIDKYDFGSGQATAILEIPENKVVTQVLTIADNARVREYRVSHTVRFRLTDAAGNELMEMQTMRQAREISFDEQKILASSREQEYIKEDLAENLARQIVNRLESVSVGAGG